MKKLDKHQRIVFPSRSVSTRRVAKLTKLAINLQDYHGTTFIDKSGRVYGICGDTKNLFSCSAEPIPIKGLAFIPASQVSPVAALTSFCPQKLSRALETRCEGEPKMGQNYLAVVFRDGVSDSYGLISSAPLDYSYSHLETQQDGDSLESKIGDNF